MPKKQPEYEYQQFFIDHLPPMLNGKNGMQQMHWSKYQKIKKDWVALVAGRRLKKQMEPIRLIFTRYSTQMPDPDNVAAGFKVVGDALVANRIISDDNFGVIQEFVVRWEKSSKKEQGVLVEMEYIENC